MSIGDFVAVSTFTVGGLFFNRLGFYANYSKYTQREGETQSNKKSPQPSTIHNKSPDS
jgi:hypothetical protein